MSTLRFNTWQNTGGTEVANSTLGTGKILQVVSTTKTDTFSAALSGGGTDSATITGLNASITPSSTSSKILILATLNIAASANNATVVLQRDSTSIAIGDAAGSRQRVSTGYGDFSTGYHHSSVEVNYLDSPSTTSAVQYTFILKNSLNGAGSTVYVNRTHTDADAATVPRMVSSITVMEVAA